MNSRVAASARLVERIDAIVLDGVTDPERLAELGRLGAQLVIQRAMEDEVSAFLGRTRYAREPEARGSRNGQRARQIQTAEGPITPRSPSWSVAQHRRQYCLARHPGRSASTIEHRDLSFAL